MPSSKFPSVRAYSSLLRANKTHIKVTQELLCHASSWVTLDTYTQAVTVRNSRAQSNVIRLLQTARARLVEGGVVRELLLLCACPERRDQRENTTSSLMRFSRGRDFVPF